MQNVYLDPSQPLILSRNVSGHAIAPVLTQGGNLVYAVSRSLT